MSLGIIIGVVCVSIGAVLAYAVIVLFWPEWVGITGKTALGYEEQQREGTHIEKGYDLVDRLQQRSDQ